VDARTFLTKSGRATVEAAVAEAERTTAAEFVCAVATESGRYDRAESLVGLVIAVLGLTYLHLASNWVPASSWSGSRGVALAEAAAVVVLGFVAGSVLASVWRTLRRPFIGQAEIDGEVARAADHVFAACRLTTTRQRGGVLLYLSLFERRVVVLADTGAMAALGPDGIAALRDLAVERLRAGKSVETFTETITTAARRLAAALPPAAVDRDELPNAVFVFHPRP